MRSRNGKQEKDIVGVVLRREAHPIVVYMRFSHATMQMASPRSGETTSQLVDDSKPELFFVDTLGL